MQHTKFCVNWSTGSGEEDFKGFIPYTGLAAIWSRDPDAAYKIALPLPMEASRNLALIGQAVSEKIFEKDGHRSMGIL